MDRKGSHVRQATKVSAPRVVFTVEVGTARRIDDGRKGFALAEWYCARVLCTRYRRDRWTAPEEAIVSTPDALRGWMRERADAHLTNWVIAESAQDVLTLSEWWSHAEEQGISFAASGERKATARGRGADGAIVRCEQLVCSRSCDIVTYRERGRRWRWVSARNYWPVAGLVGRVHNEDASPHESAQAGRSDATGVPRPDGPRALLNRFTSLCDWWRRVASAPLGLTAGQCAWGVLRSTIGRGALTTHADGEVHKLERSAAHGGRASLWYSGQVQDRHARGCLQARSLDGELSVLPCGPLHHLDVSSMYPAILRDERFPVALSMTRGRVPPALLLDLCRQFGVIARVRVKSEAAEYPYRREKDTVYPVGEYTTTLAGPDLIPLLEAGEVARVYQVATYHLGTPFRGAMELLLAERAKCREKGDAQGESMCKLVANSLAGKLAQRKGQWERFSKDDLPGAWGEYHRINHPTGKVERYRYLCGAAWRHVEDETGAGPHTAAFAYLTAYGRQRMRAVRSLCPARSIVSQYTDGIWTLPAGLSALTSAGMLAREGTGALRVVGSARTGTFYGPAHYETDGNWTLSGYHCPVVDTERRTVAHSLVTPLFESRAREAPRAVMIRYLTSAMPSVAEHGRVQPDGWILPHRIIPRKGDPEE